MTKTRKRGRADTPLQELLVETRGLLESVDLMLGEHCPISPMGKDVLRGCLMGAHDNVRRCLARFE